MAQDNSTHRHPAYKLPWPRGKLNHWNKTERPSLEEQLKGCVDKLAHKHSRTQNDAEALFLNLTETLPARVRETESHRMQEGEASLSKIDAILEPLLEPGTKLDTAGDITATLVRAEDSGDMEQGLFDIIDGQPLFPWKSLSRKDQKRAARKKLRMESLEYPFTSGRPPLPYLSLFHDFQNCLEQFTGQPMKRAVSSTHEDVAGSLVTQALVLAYRLAVPTCVRTSDALLKNLRSAPPK